MIEGMPISTRIKFHVEFLLVLYLLIGCATHSIPAEFHGRWGATKEACTAEYELNVFRIEKNRVEYWESIGYATDIKLKDDVLKLKLDMTGEGERWKREESFKLDASNNTIIRNTEQGAVTSYRCIVLVQ